MITRREALKFGGIGLTVAATGGASLLMSGCSPATIAQDIVNWTPTLESTAATVASLATLLVPPDTALIAAALLAFDTLANVVSAEAKAYLAAPNQTLLQALQTGVVTFQQQVNATLLAAVKIINPQSRAAVTAGINAVATVINSIFALILQIKGNTIAASANAKTVSIMRVVPLFDRPAAERMVAAHYDESLPEARARINCSLLEIQAAGF